MGLHSATSAILSAVIFNAIIIPLLIPIALKGRQISARRRRRPVRRNLLIWGLGGVIVPFVGIKLIDMVLVALHLAATVHTRDSLTRMQNMTGPSACQPLLLVFTVVLCCSSIR